MRLIPKIITTALGLSLILNLSVADDKRTDLKIKDLQNSEISSEALGENLNNLTPEQQEVLRKQLETIREKQELSQKILKELENEGP